MSEVPSEFKDAVKLKGELGDIYRLFDEYYSRRDFDTNKGVVFASNNPPGPNLHVLDTLGLVKIDFRFGDLGGGECDTYLMTGTEKGMDLYRSLRN